MELIGHIGERQIFYCNIRSEEDWFKKISFHDWIAFTIADESDKDLLSSLASNSLDAGVCYACCAGQLASLTEDYFDEETVWREVQKSEKTGLEPDYEAAPMTTYHKNFSEGFWFAATNANQIINDAYVISNEIICIDCTNRKTRGFIINLINKINNGWLPSDSEIERPEYDS